MRQSSRRSKARCNMALTARPEVSTSAATSGQWAARRRTAIASAEATTWLLPSIWMTGFNRSHSRSDRSPARPDRTLLPHGLAGHVHILGGAGAHT